jgi:hypothetical protein
MIVIIQDPFDGTVPGFVGDFLPGIVADLHKKTPFCIEGLVHGRGKS